MRFDLKKPCKNCPFGTAETRIRFACRDRAEEIEELAYRQGFPCHLSATIDDDDDDAGYEFGPNTQHCAGAIGMFLNEGYMSWPGVGNQEIEADYSLAMAASFSEAEAFLDANTTEMDRAA